VRPTEAYVQGVLWVKRQDHEVNHALPSIAEVKTELPLFLIDEYTH
jgi:hypothetical protein